MRSKLIENLSRELSPAGLGYNGGTGNQDLGDFAMAYMIRALQSSDRRYARILTKLGHPSPIPPPDPLDELRAEADAAGMHVDRRWGEDRLRQEIARAKMPKRVEREHKPEPAVAPKVKALQAEEDDRKPAARKTDALDHDDNGQRGGSRKADNEAGRYKRRDMRATED